MYSRYNILTLILISRVFFIILCFLLQLMKFFELVFECLSATNCLIVIVLMSVVMVLFVCAFIYVTVTLFLRTLLKLHY